MFAKRRILEGYLQTQEAECGLMCLAAATRVLGVPVTAVEARQWFPTSVRGTTVSELARMASTMGLVQTAVACTARDVHALTVPAVLHWRGNHFCLYLGRRGRKILLFDPARGSREVDQQALEKDFSGAAMQLERDYSVGRSTSRGPAMVKLVQGFLSAVKGPVASLLLFSFVLQLIALAIPLLSQAAINLGAMRGSSTAIASLAASMLAVYAVTLIVEIWRSRINIGIATHLSGSASRHLFRHMLYMPVEWFDRRRIADIVSRFDSIDPIRVAVSSGLTTLVVDGTLALLLAAGLILVSPTLGSVVLASVLAAAAVKLVFAPAIAANSALASQDKIQEHAKRWETFRSIATLKLASAEDAQDRSWHERLQGFLMHNERVQGLATAQQSASVFVGNVGSVLVLVFGASMVMNGQLSIGGLFAFVMYRRYLADKLMAAMEQLSNVWTLRYHVERVAEVLDAPKERRWNDARATGEYVTDGEISFQNVYFKHSASDPALLAGLNFRIGAGETVVIQGASGSGKTTLLRLVAGLIQPSTGSIAIDATPMSVFSPQQLRGRMAAVFQTDDLFAGTVVDNVTMFSECPEAERVLQALIEAAIWDDVKRLPLGLHTPVGDGGRLFSAGQRQRILLARAFYRRPKIILLDEATANLDAEVEERVLVSLSAMSCTKIIVTHNPRVAAFANRTFILDERGMRELGRRIPLAEKV